MRTEKELDQMLIDLIDETWDYLNRRNSIVEIDILLNNMIYLSCLIENRITPWTRGGSCYLDQGFPLHFTYQLLTYFEYVLSLYEIRMSVDNFRHEIYVLEEIIKLLVSVRYKLSAYT